MTPAEFVQFLVDQCYSSDCDKCGLDKSTCNFNCESAFYLAEAMHVEGFAEACKEYRQKVVKRA